VKWKERCWILIDMFKKSGYFLLCMVICLFIAIQPVSGRCVSVKKVIFSDISFQHFFVESYTLKNVAYIWEDFFHKKPGDRSVKWQLYLLPIIFLIVQAFVIIILIIRSCLLILKENERAGIFRFGRFVRSYGTALVIMMPFIDKYKKINLDETFPDWKNLDEAELEKKLTSFFIDRAENKENNL
jgi:hypothetical protein